jgi:hypothetical protein
MTKSVRKGQRIGGNLSATEWNFVRAQTYRTSMNDVSMGASAGEAGSLDGVVQVVNRTSGALSVGDVIGLSAPSIQASDFGEFRATMLFAAVIPTDGRGDSGGEATESYAGRFGIMLDGCGPGEIGPACIWGPTWARVSMQSATDRYCDVTHNSKSSLTSGSSGSAAILYAFPRGSSYPQDTFAYVRLGNRQAGGVRMARLVETLDDDRPSAIANVWRWNPKGGDAEEGDYEETEEEVYLQCFLRPEGETIEQRTRVLFSEIGDINEIIVMGCSPDPEEETPP